MSYPLTRGVVMPVKSFQGPNRTCIKDTIGVFKILLQNVKYPCVLWVCPTNYNNPESFFGFNSTMSLGGLFR